MQRIYDAEFNGCIDHTSFLMTNPQQPSKQPTKTPQITHALQTKPQSPTEGLRTPVIQSKFPEAPQFRH
ncbi:MAG: hypothetical protein ACKO2P_14820, partial [Planctomycetota bacterium]